VEPVCDLERIWCGPGGSQRIRASRDPAEDSNFRMGTQPGFNRGCRSISQQGKKAVRLQSHDDRARGFPGRNAKSSGPMAGGVALEERSCRSSWRRRVGTEVGGCSLYAKRAAVAWASTTLSAARGTRSHLDLRARDSTKLGNRSVKIGRGRSGLDRKIAASGA
jgi:hypothetical protein